MNVIQLISSKKIIDLLLDGTFGLEKENIRTEKSGYMTETLHPSVFQDKSTNPFITTDFAESQIEMVTPPMSSNLAAFEFMQVMHDIISVNLGDEYLWPYSLPPILPKDDSLIKVAQFPQQEITQYREYLSKKYGKRKQLLSGIHYNFSFSPEFIQTIYALTDKALTYRQFTDELYLKTARGYLKYNWLIIYLFGANSVVHESYLSCCKSSVQKITSDSYNFLGGSSFRNGKNGYRNLKHFSVSYNSLEQYVSDIRSAIDDGIIIAVKEYYSQIRLKTGNKGDVLQELTHHGIKYIEIRSFDLNPLIPYGITLEQMEFTHLLLLYCLLSDDFVMSDMEYNHAMLNGILAADSNRMQDIEIHTAKGVRRNLRTCGIELLNNMYNMFMQLGLNNDKLNIVLKFKQQLDDNVTGISMTIMDGVSKQGYTKFFMDKIITYAQLSQTQYLQVAQSDNKLSYFNQIIKTLDKHYQK